MNEENSAFQKLLRTASVVAKMYDVNSFFIDTFTFSYIFLVKTSAVLFYPGLHHINIPTWSYLGNPSG